MIQIERIHHELSYKPDEVLALANSDRIEIVQNAKLSIIKSWVRFFKKINIPVVCVKQETGSYFSLWKELRLPDETLTKASSQKEALSKGLDHYFTGKPCKKGGHIAERYTSSGVCIVCSKDAQRKYKRN